LLPDPKHGRHPIQETSPKKKIKKVRRGPTHQRIRGSLPDLGAEALRKLDLCRVWRDLVAAGRGIWGEGLWNFGRTGKRGRGRREKARREEDVRGPRAKVSSWPTEGVKGRQIFVGRIILAPRHTDFNRRFGFFIARFDFWVPISSVGIFNGFCLTCTLLWKFGNIRIANVVQYENIWNEGDCRIQPMKFL
jgi:hypothetical protein